MGEKICISDLTLDALTAYIVGLGQPKFRAKQIFKWLHQKLVTEFSQMTDQPRALLAQLEEQAALGRACLEQLREDTVRLARLADKGLEPGVAEAMVKGLDGQQLMALKQSFEARAAEKYPVRTQLSYAPAEGERDREHDRAFLI